MKQYIITIIGATLLSAIGSILTPDTMRKYVSVITGFIIISVIVAPLASLRGIDLFAGVEEISAVQAEYESVYINSVADVIRKRIEGDIKQRLHEELGVDAQVSAEVVVENNNIKEISQICVTGVGTQKQTAKMLMETYKVKEVVIDGQKFIAQNSQKQE